MNFNRRIINYYKATKIISIVLITYIFISLTGYSLFSEQLVISGNVDTAEYYEGQALPVEMVILDVNNNRYTVESDHKDFLDISSERFDVDSFTTYYSKRLGLVAGQKTITYKVAFTNPTVLDFKNGTINTTILENPGNVITSISGAISKTQVKPGEQLEVSITPTHNFITVFQRHKVRAHVTFELQNKVRNFYYFVQFG